MLYCLGLKDSVNCSGAGFGTGLLRGSGSCPPADEALLLELVDELVCAEGEVS